MEHLAWAIIYLFLGPFGAIGMSWLVGGAIGGPIGTFVNLAVGVTTLAGCWALSFSLMSRAFNQNEERAAEIRKDAEERRQRLRGNLRGPTAKFKL